MAIGSSGYFIVTANTRATAVDGHTIVINGATAPVVFGFTTGPNITNNQSNIAGTTTIQAANVTVVTSATAASNIMQGSSTNILYITKMDVATEPVLVNSIDVPISGTMNSTDLTAIYVYFNASTPSISGASLLNGIVPTFGAPHTFTINVSQAMAIGSSGYFIVTVNTSATGVIGHTVKVNGATTPVVFGFTTAPNVTNSQTDLGGIQTLPVNLVSLTAKAINNYVQLNWVTTSELNGASFDVERSEDGVGFISIGNIKSKGTTSQLHNYSFVDKVPEYGHNFYRLKQIDIDNGFKYSQVVEATLNVEAMMMSNIYPNPVKNVLAYSIYSPVSKQVLLQLSAISGKILINQKITINKGKNQQLLNVVRFASGQYQLSIVDPETNTRLNKEIIILQ